MPQSIERTCNGYDGGRVAGTWISEGPRYVALSHEYGERISRFEHVAAALVDDAGRRLRGRQ
jgi:hypothetical protein